MNKKQLKILLRSNEKPYRNIKYKLVSRTLTFSYWNNYYSCDEMIKRKFAKWVYL